MLRGASGWLGLMRVLWEQGGERVFREGRGGRGKRGRGEGGQRMAEAGRSEGIKKDTERKARRRREKRGLLVMRDEKRGKGRREGEGKKGKEAKEVTGRGADGNRKEEGEGRGGKGGGRRMKTWRGSSQVAMGVSEGKAGKGTERGEKEKEIRRERDKVESWRRAGLREEKEKTGGKEGGRGNARVGAE
jgi:hypothetical protein